MPTFQPRASAHRSAGLYSGDGQQYTGNAYVYLLASRIDPNLCKIGKGNPTARCQYWNENSPYGGILNNNLMVFAAYEFATEEESLTYESKAHAVYSFVNLNPNASSGEQEFFQVPPMQAKATLDIFYSEYKSHRSQRQAAEQAQREAAEYAEREATERERRKAAEQREAEAQARIESNRSLVAEQIDWYARKITFDHEQLRLAAERESIERAAREAAEDLASELSQDLTTASYATRATLDLLISHGSIDRRNLPVLYKSVKRNCVSASHYPLLSIPHFIEVRDIKYPERFKFHMFEAEAEIVGQVLNLKPCLIDEYEHGKGAYVFFTVDAVEFAVKHDERIDASAKSRNAYFVRERKIIAANQPAKITEQAIVQTNGIIQRLITRIFN